MAIDLRSILASAVNTAFDVAGQATKDVTLRQSAGADAVFVPIAGKFTDPTVQDTAVSGIFYQSRDQKLSENAAKTASVLLRVDELKEKGFIGDITDSDTLIIESVTWSVTRADLDPVGVTWIVQIRR